MRSVIIKIICAPLLFLLTFFPLTISLAQEDTDTQISIVALTIPSTCKLTISQPNASMTLSQDGTAEAAFEAGFAEFDAGNPTLKVSSNKHWKLYARSSGFSANGSYTKDIGDLQLKDTGSSHVTMSSYTSLTDQNQEIASHSAGVRNEEHLCQYKILLDWSHDIPGTYEATVTYTLTTDAS